jgi:hypothetical protein
LLPKFGIYGVALGTGISITITKLFIQPRIVCEELGIPLRRYYLDLLGTPFWKTALPFAVVAFPLHGFVRADYWNLLLLISIQGVISGAVIFLLLFTNEERAKIILWFQRLGKRPLPE